MPDDKKVSDDKSSVMDFDDGEDYEVLPESEVKGLRDELRKARKFDLSPSKELHISVNELNAKLDKLIGIFDEASRDLKIEEGGLTFHEKMRPLAEKMNKILEQNAEIAEGIVAIADIVKEFKDELETKGVLVAEKPAPPSLFAEQPAPQMPAFAVSQAPRLPPSAFEAPRASPVSPPMSPPKKRLFGL
ncbi:hypothetical protein HY484_03625 [Candidatus Woesearchaeota archaeon]|nr:hypothetical protein [Candidatus Woesearchaeota archaeon]